MSFSALQELYQQRVGPLTAVDYLIEKIGYQKDGQWYINIKEDTNIQHWVEDAKKIMKEQIMYAYKCGRVEINRVQHDFRTNEEKHYNETYLKPSKKNTTQLPGIDPGQVIPSDPMTVKETIV